MSAPYILGISALYHDSAAVLLHGHDIVAAVEEERFSRIKHDRSFPRQAIAYCLSRLPAGARVHLAAYYDDPALTLDRVLATAVHFAPEGLGAWQQAAVEIFGNKAGLHERIAQALGDDAEILCVRHHMSHAASGFFPSPFDEAAILCADGVGEWATTTIGHGRGAAIEPLRRLDFPHSLGLLYSAFTHFCGFKVNSGEYKLMGLAPFGEPRFVKAILDHVIDLRDDGSFALDVRYFNLASTRGLASKKFEELFGGAKRDPESTITRREADLAASIQAVLEEAVLRLSAQAQRLTNSRRLCMAGGVALNCVANAKIARSGLFERMWIQPAAGDSGGALGAALYAAFHHVGVARSAASGRDGQKGSRLGPAFGDDVVKSVLANYGIAGRFVANDEERHALLATTLAQGKIVGYFKGAMEFGPRALGARSILADPRADDAQSRVNLKIKRRESWRPFAPAVLEEHAASLFDLTQDSPYMLFTAPLRESLRLKAEPVSDEAGEFDLVRTINRKRSHLPAITHVDWSARVQTVSREEHPDFHGLISAFHRLTGCPVLLNTSFNVRGEPIVCTPENAIQCLLSTEIDLLAIEGYLVEKAELPESVRIVKRTPAFEPD
ncbi:MAG: hypothetical protein HZC25_08300 [Rhodospirillales bacterium]|nr:hypothetical protein [Rhodospirillales bacterium]